MPTAKKLPSGSWRCRTYSHTSPDGKRHYKSFTAPTRKQAEYMAAEFSLDRDRHTDADNWTLSEAIDSYIELKRPVLSPSTIYSYEQIRKTAFSSIMGVALCRITEDMAQEAVNREADRIPANRTAPISAKTLKNEVGLLMAVLNRYQGRRKLHIDVPKRPRRIRTLPSPKAVYEAVRGTNVELPALLAMWLSFTMSEIRGLTKSKSIDGDYITIREVLVNIGGEDVRKPLAKEVTRNRRHRLPEHIKRLVDQVEGDVLVPMSQKTLLRTFRRRLKDAGLEEITFHDLRHINASLMAMLRIPDKYAQERGGWKTDHVMKSVYTETFSEERERVDDVIDGYFEDFV